MLLEWRLYHLPALHVLRKTLNVLAYESTSCNLSNCQPWYIGLVPSAKLLSLFWRRSDFACVRNFYSHYHGEVEIRNRAWITLWFRPWVLRNGRAVRRVESVLIYAVCGFSMCLAIIYRRKNLPIRFLSSCLSFVGKGWALCSSNHSSSIAFWELEGVFMRAQWISV